MDLEYDVNEIEENIINDLEKFLNQLRKIDNYWEILPQIIETHFSIDDEDFLFRKLYLHIRESFKTDPMFLFNYLTYNQFLNTDELSSSNKKAMECINKLKIKYGPILRDLIKNNNNPFVIDSVGTNIEKDGTLHGITISRADGEMLKGQFSADNLLGITTSLLSALYNSLDKGIYNLNYNKVTDFLKESNNLNNYLNELISDEKED